MVPSSVPVCPCNQPGSTAPCPYPHPQNQRQKPAREHWLRKSPESDPGASPPRLHPVPSLVQHAGVSHKQCAPRCRRRREAAPSRCSWHPARPWDTALHLQGRGQGPRARASPLVYTSLSRRSPYGLQWHCLSGRAVQTPAASDFWRRCRLRNAAPPDGAHPNLLPLGCSLRGPRS